MNILNNIVRVDAKTATSSIVNTIEKPVIESVEI